MKKLIRAISALLVIGILMATPVYASTSNNQRASAFFSSYTVSLLQKEGYRYDVFFDVTSVGIMEELGATSVEIQRSADRGNTWEHVCTYSSVIIPDLINENSASHLWSAARIATKGYRYRAIVTFYAKNSSGSGYNTLYSTNELQY